MAKNKNDYSSMCRLSNPKMATGILPLDIITNGGIVRGDIVALTAAEGVGKCLTKDNIIYTAEGLRRLADLVEVPGLAGEGTSIVAEVRLQVLGQVHYSKKLYHRGVSPVYKLTTKWGHTITATPEHKVRMASGEWKDVSDISVGEKVELNYEEHGAEVQRPLAYPICADVSDEVRQEIGGRECWVMGYLYSHTALCAGNFGTGKFYAYVDMMDISEREDKIALVDTLQSLGADVVLTGESIIKFAYDQKSFMGAAFNRWEKKSARIPWFIWKNCYENQVQFVLGYMAKSDVKECFSEGAVRFHSYEVARFAKNVFQLNKSNYRIYCDCGSWYVGELDFKSEGEDAVVSIEYAGMEEVFDIQDSDCSCFIAEGIVVHNSTTMMQLVKNRIAQEQNVAFLDVETGFTEDILRDSYHVLEYHSCEIGQNKLFMVSPTTWAEVDELFTKILESDYYSDIIIDSISSIISSGLGIKNIEQGAAIGEDARMQSLFLRKYKPLLRAKGVTLWCVNQVRANISNTGFSGFGAPLTKPSGGKALKHMADILLTMSAGEPITRRGINTINQDDKAVVIGNKAWLKADKNRRAMPKIKVMIAILFGLGVSNQMSLFDILLKSSYLTQSSPGRYVLNGFDDQKLQGQEKVFAYIRDNYAELLPWCEKQGILNLIQEGIQVDDEIESVDAE